MLAGAIAAMPGSQLLELHVIDFGDGVSAIAMPARGALTTCRLVKPA